MRAFVIRQAQMDAMSRALRHRFAEAAAKDLHERFAAFVGDLTDMQLLQRVEESMEQALTYGIRHEYDVKRYLEFDVMYGPGFTSVHERAGEILRRQDLDSARKMELIENWELFERPSPRNP